MTPTQAGVVASQVAATTYYVELHPLDKPDLPTLQKIHNQWHASGIRMDYDPTLPEAFYDQLLDNARKAGLKMDFTTPYTTLPSNVTAYAKAAGVAARRYANSGMTWEIYNEPDLLFGEDVNAGVAGYVALAKPTALAIRANDPTATILTGGTSGKDRDFSFAIAAGKALAPFVNGVAIHSYGVDYNSMSAAVVKVSVATGAVVYITEWATSDSNGLGQAMASAKGFTPMFCVYEYQEQAAETAAGDQVWGLVNSGAWSTFAAGTQ